jgi:hypothetical protein
MAYVSTLKTDKEREAKWQAEADLKTLTEARAIRKDKKRLKAAMMCAKEQMAALQGVKEP